MPNAQVATLRRRGPDARSVHVGPGLGHENWAGRIRALLMLELWFRMWIDATGTGADPGVKLRGMPEPVGL